MHLLPRRSLFCSWRTTWSPGPEGYCRPAPWRIWAKYWPSRGGSEGKDNPVSYLAAFVKIGQQCPWGLRRAKRLADRFRHLRAILLLRSIRGFGHRVVGPPPTRRLTNRIRLTIDLGFYGVFYLFEYRTLNRRASHWLTAPLVVRFELEKSKKDHAPHRSPRSPPHPK